MKFNFTTVGRYILLISIALTLFYMGMMRDSIFIHLNQLLENTTANKLHSHVYTTSHLHFISYMTLYFTKWILTIAFTLVYLFLGCLSIYLIYHKLAYVVGCLLFFIFVFVLAFVFMLIGYFINDYALGYLFARKLMGLAQSPALLMILIPAFKLLKD
jgi:hypothetical protein